jgi:hypothetical protein
MMLQTQHIFSMEDLTSTTELETSGRDGANMGAWAINQQFGFDRSTEYSHMSIDPSSGYVAILTNIGSGHTITLHNYAEWSYESHRIDGTYSANGITFSPTGSHLAIWGHLRLQMWSTTDWSLLIDETIDEGILNDFSWSGDGERLVFTTGEEVLMYEAPDWDSVTGPEPSEPWAVAHDPTEDTIWFVKSSGGGDEYKLENIPFVGDRWVFQSSFTPPYTTSLEASPDGTMLLALDTQSTNQLTVIASDDYEHLFGGNYYGDAAFSADSNLLTYTYGDWYYVYSTTTWQMTFSSIVEGTQSWYGMIRGIGFTLDDAEIITFLDEDGDGLLIGWKADEDGDGVIDEADECPDSPDDESANTRGCVPSQRDIDSDGVNDRDDICPRTALGASVDTEGCSVAQLTDSDEDGIADSDDICTNTPEGEVADLAGCGPSERDVDDDGLNDAVDPCPLSPAITCPAIQSWAPGEVGISGSGAAYLSAWDPLDRTIAVMNQREEITLHNAVDGSLVSQLTPPDSDIYYRYLAWHPGGDWLAIGWQNDGGSDYSCGYLLWHPGNQSLGKMVTTGCRYLRAITVSPDGERIALATYSGLYVLWALNGTLAYSDADYSVYDVDFSPDGSRLVGVLYDSIILWDARDGYVLDTRSSSSDAWDARFTPLGDRIVVSGYDNYITLYSADTLQLLGTVNTGYELVTEITFSRDATMFYAAALEYAGGGEYNGSILTFALNADGSAELLSASVEDDGIYHFTIAPDERWLLITPLNGEPFFWDPDADADGTIDADDLCDQTSANESADENGCSWSQRDDDEDGVTNGNDLCWNTPSLVLIDGSGCSDQQVDEDFDGVCDPFASSGGPSNCTGEDFCPATSLNADVNEVGCSWEQEDDDHDGITNGNDNCPDTEGGDETDTFGCGLRQRDGDGDGLNDFWDFCTDSSEGVPVDENGCADAQVDADDDGVCNSGAASVGPANCTGSDLCPGTDNNSTIDANGCAWEQLDDDGDGVKNQRDECPDTSNSDIVSPEGCSGWQLDSDDDGIVDALDECSKTPQGEFANQTGCSASQNVVEQNEGVESSFLSSPLLLGGALVAILILLASFIIISRGKGSEIAEVPKYETRGDMRSDGKEWLEHPKGSDIWYYRDHETNQWVIS